MIMSEETYNSQNNVNENINIENIATISSDTENECKSSAITDGYLEGPNLSRRRKKKILINSMVPNNISGMLFWFNGNVKEKKKKG